MRFPTQLREEVCQLVRWHDEDIPQTDEAVRRWLNLLGPVQLRRLLLLQQADSRAKSPRSDTLFAGGSSSGWKTFCKEGTALP